MAKSGCLMDLKSSLIRELYKVNMTDEQFNEMQQTVNKRKITIEDERQPSFKPSYYEQPQQKKDKDNDLSF